MIINRI